MSTASRTLLLGALVLVAGAPRIAAARGSDDPATRSARLHYEEGTKRYNLGRYKEAQKEFEDGYLAKSDPVFLYNIGQCHRMLGEYDEAVNSYRSYLRSKPDAPNREAVEKLIDEESKEIERKNAERTKALPPQEVRPPETTPAVTTPATATPASETTVAAAGGEEGRATPVYKKWWLWAAVGAVVLVGAGVGAGIALAAPSDPSVPHTAGGHYDVGFH